MMSQTTGIRSGRDPTCSIGYELAREVLKSPEVIFNAEPSRQSTASSSSVSTVTDHASSKTPVHKTTSPSTSPLPPSSSSRKQASYPVKYGEYEDVVKRIESFVGWPVAVVKQAPRRMARCGFFYIGSADRVRCFSCGTTLRNWEPGDNPYKEHLTWAPKCLFIRAIEEPEEESIQAVPPSSVDEVALPAPLTTECSNGIARGDCIQKDASGSAPAAAAAGEGKAKEAAGGESSGRGHESSTTGSPDRSTTDARYRQEVGGNSPPRSADVTFEVQKVTQTPSQDGEPMTSSEKPASDVAKTTDDVMKSAQVLAVVQMGIPQESVEEAIRVRLSQSLGLFPSAAELFVAAENIALKAA